MTLPLPANDPLDWLITDAAHTGIKGDWNTYERFKRRLNNLNCTPEEYEWAIHRLCEVLEL